jgi:hypothetical protein
MAATDLYDRQPNRTAQQRHPSQTSAGYPRMASAFALSILENFKAKAA